MEPEDIFIKCFLCPGLCISNCPVYSVTRDRSTAPNIIARSGYYLIRKGDRELGINTLECTGCGNCELSCPINNPLPKAIRLSRKILFEKRMEGIVEEHLSQAGRELFIYRPDKPSNQLIRYLVRNGYKVIWIDTSNLYKYYSMGLLEDISLKTPVITDEIEILDDYTSYLEGLKILMKNKRDELNEYTLHIPCRLTRYEDEIIAIIERIFSKPSRVVSGCVGGGWMLPTYNPEYSKLILDRRLKDSKGKIITLCIRARMHMRDMGFEAYTILDILGGE